MSALPSELDGDVCGDIPHGSSWVPRHLGVGGESTIAGGSDRGNGIDAACSINCLQLIVAVDDNGVLVEDPVYTILQLLHLLWMINARWL